MGAILNSVENSRMLEVKSLGRKFQLAKTSLGSIGEMVVEEAKDPTKVFISYSWDSPEHKERVSQLAKRLREEEGLDVEIDEYVRTQPPFTPKSGHWNVWMRKKIKWAEFVLMVFTETYKRRFEGEEEPGQGSGVALEARIISGILGKESQQDTKFIPIVLSSSDSNYISDSLWNKDRYDTSNEESFATLCARLRKQPIGEKPKIGNPSSEFVTPQPSHNLETKIPSFPNYDPQTWAGRDALISDLLPKLQEQTRLLWLTGISGIGKTALGGCLASQALEYNPSFQWIYLEILEQSKDFASEAVRLLAKLGDRNLPPEALNNPKWLADRLVQKLQARPYWIQIDALERLLSPEQPTKFIDDYWITFFRDCLTEENFASRLVLTAQALPEDLLKFQDDYSNTWRDVRLSGLLEVDQRLDFFAKSGVDVGEANQEILTRIAAIYEGHPLVLKVIAEDIKELPGDVLRYWQDNQQEFEQVARELQDARLNETKYNEALNDRVRERIRKSLEQLLVDALDLLCRSSVFRRPVPKKFWLAMISDRTLQQQKAAYRCLGDRALIEKEGTYIRQHNLIRSVAYDLLKVDANAWHEAERQAAHLWFTVYEPASNAPKLENVRGYLEAFDHYCEAEDWEQAGEIYMQKLEITHEELYWQLLTWGNYQELLKISIRLAPKASLNIKIRCFLSLGNAYHHLGNQNKAIEYHQTALATAREIGDRRSEGSALGNLGLAYHRLGHFERTIDFSQQYLMITREIGDRQGEGNALGNLGITYYCLGQYEQAINFLQQYLTITREIGNRRGESYALGNLGSAYDSLGQYERAIDFVQQQLTIAREVGDRRSEGAALVNMGSTQLELKQYRESLAHNQAALKLFREIGDRVGIAEALKNLAELHQVLGEVSLSRQYCQQALTLATELGIPLTAECEALQLKMENKKWEEKEMAVEREIE